MKLTTKILIIIGSILTFGLLSVIVYQQYELKQQQAQIQKSVILQKTLVDNLVRAESQYATSADVKALVAANGLNLQAIQSDLNKFHASLNTVNAVVVNSAGVKTTNVASTGTGAVNPTPPTPATVACDGHQIECPQQDAFGFLEKSQNLDLTEPFGTVQVPIGTVSFSAWQAKPWSETILPREYHLTSVVGTDDQERQYFYNKMTVKEGDKSYDVPISTSQTTQVVPSPKFSWFNPRLYAVGDASLNITKFKGDTGFGATLGLMSYGTSLPNPQFSILQLGLVYQAVSKQPAVIVSPVNINIGKLFPNNLVRSSYIGPSLQIGFHGDFMAGAAVSVGL